MKNNSTNNNQNRRPNNQRPRPTHNILPPPRVLEDYEIAAPGSVSKLMELAKKEQEHRHSWQDRYLKFHNFSYRTGIFFGFIYNAALLYLIFDLIKQGSQDLAIKLFAINAALIAFAIIATKIERRMTTRKPPRRSFPQKKPHNNNK
ncbi:MAG: putative membrane protein [Lentimonas sp.]|jgi:uncharacterized membrane protein